ncbi:MAG: glycosyltransferase [Planctomycetaceae bacterium]
MMQTALRTDANRTTKPEPAEFAQPRPIRVCYLIDNLNHGGTELRLLRLIQSHDRHLVEPSLSLLDGTTSASLELKPATCDVRSWEIHNVRSISTTRKIFEMARYLRQKRIDVLQLYFRDSMLVGVPAAYLAGVPHVVMNAFNLGYWMTGFDRWLYRRFAPFVDGMIVNCHAVRDALIAQVNWPREKITVIENGIDLAAFSHLTSWTPPVSATATRQIGMVGNLRAVKDPVTLLKAAAIVNSRHPHARFTIAGEGELRPELERLRSDLGLDGVVDLPGAIADIPAFLATLDIAVLCSQTEGMSNAVIEYMAAGRPIIVTDVGGNPELIEHNQSGLLIRPNSPAELAVSIERLLENPAFGARMASTAQAEALRRFNLHSMTRRYENYYATMCNRPSLNDSK